MLIVKEYLIYSPKCIQALTGVLFCLVPCLSPVYTDVLYWIQHDSVLFWTSNCQVSYSVYQMRALQPSSESLHGFLNSHRSHSFCFLLWNVLGMSLCLSTLWTVGNTKIVWEKVYRTYEAKVSKPNTRVLKNTTLKDFQTHLFPLCRRFFSAPKPNSPMPDSSWS